MSPLNQQLHLKAVTAYTDPTNTLPPTGNGNPPYTIRPRATIGYLEHGLKYSLDPIRRGLEAIFKNERGPASPLGYCPSSLDLFAFIIKAAPHILEAASDQLLLTVKRHHTRRSSFTISDHRHYVLIRVLGNVIEEVTPLDEGETSQSHG